jgi:hypothetical protein
MSEFELKLTGEVAHPLFPEILTVMAFVGGLTTIIELLPTFRHWKLYVPGAVRTSVPPELTETFL